MKLLRSLGAALASLTDGVIIADARGRHVSVESEPGRGSTFSFTLPVA